MLRCAISSTIGLLCLAGASHAAPATNALPPGWILGLTWSPDYCSGNLMSKEPQCTDEHYFTVDGLYPHFDTDDHDCDGDSLPKDQSERWMSVIPNQSQIRRLWRRYGACSGLSSTDYFTELERGSRRIAIPPQFGNVTDTLKMPRADVKDAFIKINPGLTEDAIALECHGSELSRVQICLDGKFEFHACNLPKSCKDEVRFRAINPNRVGHEPVYR